MTEADLIALFLELRDDIDSTPFAHEAAWDVLGGAR